jgi:transposase
MRQVREVLRLTTAGVGLNEIARRVGVAPSTVRLTLKRLATAGLSWPLPAEMTDSALEGLAFVTAQPPLSDPQTADRERSGYLGTLNQKHSALRR